MASNQDCSDEAVYSEDAGKDTREQIWNAADSLPISLFSVMKTTVKGSYLLRTAISGLKMPDAKTPALDLAVPYAAPKLAKTIEATHPMALKKGCRGS